MNISGPAAVAKPEMLFYAPGDLTVTLLEGLDGIIPQSLQNKIWDMIWQRWEYYENLCSQR